MFLQLAVFAGETGDDGAEGFLLGDAEGIPGFHQTGVFFRRAVGDEGNFQIRAVYRSGFRTADCFFETDEGGIPGTAVGAVYARAQMQRTVVGILFEAVVDAGKRCFPFMERIAPVR